MESNDIHGRYVYSSDVPGLGAYTKPRLGDERLGVGSDYMSECDMVAYSAIPSDRMNVFYRARRMERSIPGRRTEPLPKSAMF